MAVLVTVEQMSCTWSSGRAVTPPMVRARARFPCLPPQDMMAKHREEHSGEHREVRRDLHLDVGGASAMEEEIRRLGEE